MSIVAGGWKSALNLFFKRMHFSCPWNSYERAKVSIQKFAILIEKY